MPSSLQRAATYCQCTVLYFHFPMILRTDVLGRQHGSVGRGLVTIGLDLHATGDTGDGFAARQIGDVDEGIVEGSKDSGDAEDELALFRRLVRPSNWRSRSTCLADLGSKLQKLALFNS
jgi:hypothetical protein